MFSIGVKIYTGCEIKQYVIVRFVNFRPQEALAIDYHVQKWLKPQGEESGNKIFLIEPNCVYFQENEKVLEMISHLYYALAYVHRGI